jgi:DNA primase
MSFERVDVAKLLERLGIKARRRAKEWEAFCPNPDHKDRSPSWRIRDEPGSSRHGCHHCWPCGFGGTVVDLVQRVKGISDWKDARAWILEGAPVEQQVVGEVAVAIRPANGRFRLPSEVRFGLLESWPGPVRDYVQSRGIDAYQVERWGIGYAVDGRLRGRIVFPLRDSRGRPRGYSARSFTGEGKRFLEPEENEHASPSAIFGEQFWPSLEERKRCPVFVFEGAIKALAVDRVLPGAFVAAMTGSEVRPLHDAKLGTFGWQCVVGDDDMAGNKVSSQLIDKLVRHANPSRLVLPRGLDADELPPDELRGILLEWLRRR